MGDLETAANVAIVCKEIGKAVGEGVTKTGMELLKSLLGEPCRIGSGILVDQIQFWQWKNRVRICGKAKKIMDENKVAAKVLPPGFFLPLLEACGNVEDEELQGMWARLISSAAANDDAQHPAFINCLKQMTPDDAKRLSQVGRLSEELHKTKLTFGKGSYSRPTPSPADDPQIARLIALGLVRPVYRISANEPLKHPTTGEAVVGGPRHATPNRPLFSGPRIAVDRVELSAYGSQFLAAVLPPKTTRQGSKSK